MFLSLEKEIGKQLNLVCTVTCKSILPSKIERIAVVSYAGGQTNDTFQSYFVTEARIFFIIKGNSTLSEHT